ncbi:hypothetical protein Sjap_019147 [Stephania japonica]|uniref:Pentatricopeptide repeat-containing protein n=1 Tax=Stephania japonica TaxID=461633 RepID=A0AAP0HUG2_9MAGN
MCSNWALEQGRWIHGFIEENNIRIYTVIGTTLVDMHAKCGCIDKSLGIFRRVEDGDTALWTTIVCGLAMNEQTNKALELFSEMLTVAVKPDDITLVGVLSACNHGGLVEEGRMYFHSMKKVYGIEPKI